MPNLGIETIGGFTRSIDNTIRGHRVTMPEDAQAGVTITAYIEDAATGDSFKAALIQDADKTTVLAESAVRTDISTAGWYTFSGGSLASYAPANAESFVVCVVSDSADSASIYYDLDGQGWGAGITDYDPLTLFTALEEDTRTYSIYLTYTEDSGEITEALTGVAATGSPGTLTPHLTVALTGVSATAALGALGPSLSAPLSGLQMEGQVGALSPALAKALTGLEATGAIGTLAPAHAIPLLGQNIQGALGTLTPEGGDGVPISAEHPTIRLGWPFHPGSLGGSW